MAVNNTTPLIALDALVIDTETTGLDPAKARVVEIAGVPLVGSHLDEPNGFRLLINPGVPIPASATQIHGIDNAAVASAPSLVEAWPDVSERLAAPVLIGHTIGFDIAVLKREAARAGMTWQPPRILCTQLLAQAAAPTLGGYSLEHLASWLGIELSGRHSAVGDAVAAARIFLALLPKLRDRNIRTLAEAERACRAHLGAVEGQHGAGWHEGFAPAQPRGTLARIDLYPYRHRVADVMSTPVRSIAATEPLSRALKQMSHAKISSLLVGVPPLRAGNVAIITERDVMRALAAWGAGALERPVADFASKPLATVPAGAFIYRALGRMARLKLRHLAVLDETGNVLGMISARDLLRLRAQEATILGDGIDQADTVQELAAAWAQLPHAAGALFDERVSARDIAAVISRELGALTRRAAILAERMMREAGLGEPPCPYVVCVLGSAGRGESLLAMDQDNAIAFSQGKPSGAEDHWFAQLGTRFADILHEVGVPYCQGGVMAKNEPWRGSVDTWRERVSTWISRSNSRDLLSIDIFFDLAGVHGDLALANEIWRHGFNAAQGNASFAKLLVDAAGDMESGLTFLGGFATLYDRIDLKRTGLIGIVTMARALAIRHHIVERSTPGRLAGLAALKKGTGDLASLAAAHDVFLKFVLAQQLADIDAGLPPSNKVEVTRLTRTQRARLKEALRSVAHLDALTRDLLF